MNVSIVCKHELYLWMYIIVFSLTDLFGVNTFQMPCLLHHHLQHQRQQQLRQRRQQQLRQQQLRLQQQRCPIQITVHLMIPSLPPSYCRTKQS